MECLWPDKTPVFRPFSTWLGFCCSLGRRYLHFEAYETYEAGRPRIDGDFELFHRLGPEPASSPSPFRYGAVRFAEWERDQ